MKLHYSFIFLFVLKVVFSHPASSESDLQSENMSGLDENSTSDRISLSKLDDSHITSEKRSYDGKGTEGTEIISCAKPFDSANHTDVIETFCSNSSNQSAEDITKPAENSIQSTATEFQHINTSSKEAYVISNLSIVNMIDDSLTNLTTYEGYEDNTFAPFNTSDTCYISTGDVQDLDLDLHERNESTHDDLLPSKNQDAARVINFANVASETTTTAK